MKHQYLNKQILGYRSWKECKLCGTAINKGFYWLANYKSIIEPECGNLKLNKKWIENAIEWMKLN